MLVSIVLRIVAGPEAGRTLALGPGERRLVGRAPNADLRVTSDEYLSDLHVALDVDAEGICSAQDLCSSNGTLLNGVRLEKAVIKHGDTITAGATEMVVAITRDAGAGVDSPPPPPPPLPSPPADETVAFSRSSSEAVIVAGIEAAPGDLFAALDVSRDPAILELLQKSGERADPLYTAPRTERLDSAAPYLASIPRGSRLLRRLVRHGWRKSWGIYLTSERPFEVILDHLRTLLVLPEGEREALSFRLYNPRLLRAFMPSCSPEQARRFFGPIAAIVLEAKDGDAILRLDAPSASASLAGEPLQLLPAQIELLERETIELFIDRMEGILRRDYARELAAWDPGAAGLRGAICDGMTRAAGYGVEREDDVERFLKLMAILGPKFDEDSTMPWAGEILRRKVVGSPRKLDALKEHLAARYGRTV